MLSNVFRITYLVSGSARVQKQAVASDSVLLTILVRGFSYPNRLIFIVFKLIEVQSKMSL